MTAQPMAKTVVTTSRRALGESVYGTIIEWLRLGKLQPGDRLVEDDVAATLNVSRTPVREALQRLQAKKLVEPTNGRGLVVRNLATGEIVELYAMREILEGAAARLAAIHAVEPEILALRDLDARFREHLDDPAEMAEINRRMHNAILRAARNRFLDLCARDLRDTILLLGETTFVVDKRPGSAADEHRKLIDAIADRDADRAERLARFHIQGALRARFTIVGKSGHQD